MAIFSSEMHELFIKWLAIPCVSSLEKRETHEGELERLVATSVRKLCLHFAQRAGKMTRGTLFRWPCRRCLMLARFCPFGRTERSSGGFFCRWQRSRLTWRMDIANLWRMHAYDDVTCTADVRWCRTCYATYVIVCDAMMCEVCCLLLSVCCTKDAVWCVLLAVCCVLFPVCWVMYTVWCVS